MTDAALMTHLLPALRECVGPDGLREAAATAAYSLDGVEPWAAVVPCDEDEASRALALASEHGLAVVPWGGGAHQSVGHLPTRYDLALDLRRMNQIRAYEPADMTVTVHAGVTVTDLQRVLARGRSVLPPGPAASRSRHDRRGGGREPQRSVALPVRDGPRPGAGDARGACGRYDHQGGRPRREECHGLRRDQAARGGPRDAGGGPRGHPSGTAAAGSRAGLVAGRCARRGMPDPCHTSARLASGAQSPGSHRRGRQGDLWLAGTRPSADDQLRRGSGRGRGPSGGA